jgi:hypothetical protein
MVAGGSAAIRSHANPIRSGGLHAFNSVAALWLSCPFCRASARLFL